MNTHRAVRLSFVIKTYNEEGKIARCIESVLAAGREAGYPFEIIVADSVSSDRTVAIASRYPVKVVQFRHPEERGCGAGVQLGYQHASGELVFFLDGDMTLLPGFLPAALKALEQAPRLAGVAGLMREAAVRNAFDAGRVGGGAASVARDERWLNGGGLYRRCAIEAAGGYAANRNLKGWEEAELGMRLRAAGWQLQRIGVAATVHDGHASDTWRLLARHWRSGRLMAHGVLLRDAFGKPWFSEAVRALMHPLGVVIAWTAAVALWLLGSTLPGLLQAYGVLLLGAWLLFALRKKSLAKAAISVVLWHVHAAGIIKGLFLRGVPVSVPIQSAILVDPLHS